MRRRRKALAGYSLAAAVGAAGAARGAFAQTWTHDAAGTFQWSDPANWSPGLPVSASSAHLTFLGSSSPPYTANNNLASPFRLNQLILSASAQDQITGSALQFEIDGSMLPQVIQSGSNNFTIGAPLVLNADTTFSGSSTAASLTLLGPISGTGALIKTAGLPLTYGRLGGPTPDATFSGGTRLLGGTLDLWGDAGTMPAFGSGQIILSGASLTVHNTNNASWNIPNAIRINGSGSIRSERGSPVVLANNVTLNGTLSGQSLQFSSGNQLLIDNRTTGLRAIYPGRAPLATATQIAANIIDTDNIAAPNALHVRSSTVDTIISGTANTYLGGTIIEANPYSTSSYVNVTDTSSLGGGNVTVQPQARLRLGSAQNLASGKMVLVQQGGAIEFNPNTMSFDNAAISLIDPASTGILLLTGSPAPGLNLTGHEQLLLGTLTSAFITTSYTPGAGGYRLVTQNGGALYISANNPSAPVLTGPYAFTAGMTGWTGTITLYTPNDYTGGTTLNGSSLYASSNSLGTGNVNLLGGALYSTDDNILGSGASLLVNGGAAYLAYANNYTNGTILNSGRLSIAHPAALGSGTVTVSGGFFDTSVVVPNSVILTGDATFEGQTDPGAGLGGTLTLGGSRTIYSRNDFAFSGNIVRPAGDTGSLHISTTGIVRLGGTANSYTGGTAIDGYVVVNPGSSLGVGSVTLNSGQLDQFAVNGISGAGSTLTIQGGTARLYAPNNYSGTTTINGGLLSINADNNLGVTTSGLTINNGTVLSTESFSTARPITLGHANSTIDVTSGNVLTLSQPFQGNGSLTKGTNGGTLVLAQAGGVTLPNVTANGGALNIGGASGLSGPLVVTGSLTITNNATAALLPTISTSNRITTNFVSSLRIGAGGLLDIGNHLLEVDDTATPISLVQQYLQNGYHYDAKQGFGDWTGIGGITSSAAKDSIANGNGRITIGYIDGAVQNDPNIGDLGIGLPTNRILIRPALYGDVNLDGVVDANDIGAIIGLGYYGKGTAPHGWLDGDLNGDGVVDINDIGLIIGAGTFNNGSYSPNVLASIIAPEPSMMGLIAIGTMGLLRRRRRNKNRPSIFT